MNHDMGFVMEAVSRRLLDDMGPSPKTVDLHYYGMTAAEISIGMRRTFGSSWSHEAFFYRFFRKAKNDGHPSPEIKNLSESATLVRPLDADPALSDDVLSALRSHWMDDLLPRDDVTGRGTECAELLDGAVSELKALSNSPKWKSSARWIWISVIGFLTDLMDDMAGIGFVEDERRALDELSRDSNKSAPRRDRKI